MTYAIKAQRLLKQIGIRCKLLKLDGENGSGCIYGISVRDDDVSDTVHVLNLREIPYGMPK